LRIPKKFPNAKQGFLLTDGNWKHRVFSEFTRSMLNNILLSRSHEKHIDGDIRCYSLGFWMTISM